MEIREAKVADALEIARVHVDSWRSTYAGMMPQDYLDQLDVEKRAHRWEEILSSGEPKEANLVAVIEGKVAGFTSIGPSRSPSLPFAGELYALYLDDAHQKKGIGKALFLEAVREIRERKWESMVVWVLKENPTCRFYEKMGGSLLDATKLETLGEASLLEVSYGWSNLSALTSS